MHYQQPAAQNQPTANPVNQNKCKVFIDNLDQGIAEDYLYKKFKEDCGQISNIKINKDRTTQKSKGTAVITFAHPDYAEEARKKFNGQKIIKNVIRVKPFLAVYEQDKQANVNIRNIDDSVTIQKLDETFSEFGNVTSIDIRMNEQGKSLGYGYIQFEKKEDVDKLLNRIEQEPIVIAGKKVTIERFKSQGERQGAVSQMFFRAFTGELNIQQPVFQRIYELAWQTTIQNYFIDNKGMNLLSTFVKYDTFNKQPWCMLVFESADDAHDVYQHCESNRIHECFQTTTEKVRALFSKNPIPVGIDGQPEFKQEDVDKFFEFVSTVNPSPFEGSSQKFFFNFMRSKHLNVDKRLLLARNLRSDISDETIKKFFEKFGKIVRFTLKQNSNPKYKTKQAFIHYQTEGDSNTALSDVYERKMRDEVNEIFYDKKQQVTILVPVSIRKEMRQLKSAGDAKMHPQNQNKLLPQWTQPNIMPPMVPMQMGGMNRGGPANFPMGQPPMNRGQFMGPNRKQPFNRQPGQFPQGGNRYPQQGGPNTRMPQNNQMRPPNMYPNQMPMQPGQMMVNQQQQPPQQQPPVAFRTYEEINENIQRFISQHPKVQRNQLGNCLIPRVEQHLREFQSPVEWAQRVTGMLIDEKQFEISEILGLFNEGEELRSRVQEGIELIKEENEDESG